jgi:hypothetical protein
MGTGCSTQGHTPLVSVTPECDFGLSASQAKPAKGPRCAGACLVLIDRCPQHLGDTSRVNGLALVLTLATVRGEDTGWQDLKRPCDIRSDVLEKGKWIARRHFESARDCLKCERVIRQ